MFTALRLRLTLLLSACLVSIAPGQTTVRPESHPGGVLFVVRDKSGLVTNDSPLYLASNQVGWNPGAEAMKLSGRSDLRWQILLPGPVGDPPLEFKFTRGSWETVEVAADLGDISNRTLRPVEEGSVAPDRPVVVELEIERFADERAGAPRGQFRDDPTRAIEVTGEVRRLQVIGGAGAASGAMRDVLVWLPPGYDEPANAGRRYPVLYLQDGQNVFDHRAPTPAEWGADETATRLIGAGEIEPLIIVAIPNSGANRIAEYLPSGLETGLRVEGRGDGYVDWLVREVVPRVERAFRADAARRGIGGSSLGGLLALRAAAMYPDDFERVLVESPSLLVGGADVTERMLGDLAPGERRVFIGMGGREGGGRSGDLVRAAQELAERLSAASAGGSIRIKIDPDAAHDEHAWAARLPEALQHLYGTD